jgi:hypothetical protein
MIRGFYRLTGCSLAVLSLCDDLGGFLFGEFVSALIVGVDDVVDLFGLFE